MHVFSLVPSPSDLLPFLLSCETKPQLLIPNKHHLVGRAIELWHGVVFNSQHSKFCCSDVKVALVLGFLSRKFRSGHLVFFDGLDFNVFVEDKKIYIRYKKFPKLEKGTSKGSNLYM